MRFPSLLPKSWRARFFPPQEEVNKTVQEFLDTPPDLKLAAECTRRLSLKPELVRDDAYREGLLSFIEERLTPQLVEPRSLRANVPVTSAGNRRMINPHWIILTMAELSMTEEEAYALAAKTAIDFEFRGKLRDKIQILKRDWNNPLRINIKVIGI